MEIFNHGKHLNVPAPHFSTAPSVDDAAETRREDDVKQIDQAEPHRLLAKLNDLANFRLQTLAEVKAKVQAGEYFTRAAAERTAEQIVGL
ncbi:MAG TPA: hypothetical protein PKD54_12915 [Pirellulaceae bacterium]|nr:hypothetical protein [Pirellulaceae bacterium]